MEGFFVFVEVGELILHTPDHVVGVLDGGEVEDLLNCDQPVGGVLLFLLLPIEVVELGLHAFDESDSLRRVDVGLAQGGPGGGAFVEPIHERPQQGDEVLFCLFGQVDESVDAMGERIVQGREAGLLGRLGAAVCGRLGVVVEVGQLGLHVLDHREGALGREAGLLQRLVFLPEPVEPGGEVLDEVFQLAGVVHGADAENVAGFRGKSVGGGGRGKGLQLVLDGVQERKGVVGLRVDRLELDGVVVFEDAAPHAAGGGGQRVGFRRRRDPEDLGSVRGKGIGGGQGVEVRGHAVEYVHHVVRGLVTHDAVGGRPRLDAVVEVIRNLREGFRFGGR